MGSEATFVLLVGQGYQEKTGGAQTFSGLNLQDPDRLLEVPVLLLVHRINIRSCATYL